LIVIHLDNISLSPIPWDLQQN